MMTPPEYIYFLQIEIIQEAVSIREIRSQQWAALYHQKKWRFEPVTSWWPTGHGHGQRSGALLWHNMMPAKHLIFLKTLNKIYWIGREDDNLQEHENLG